LIFAEHLEETDFWGWADNDQLWGNIRRFITEERLQSYDILGAMRCCLSGPFTILRNNEKCLNLWREIQDYPKKVNATSKSANLCETGLNAAILPIEAMGQLKVWRRHLHLTEKPSTEWDAWSQQLEKEGPHADFPYQGWPAGSAIWHRGRVFGLNDGIEYLFFHYRFWKAAFRSQLDYPVTAKTDTILVDASGIWGTRVDKHRIFQAIALIQTLPETLRRPRQVTTRFRQLWGLFKQPNLTVNQNHPAFKHPLTLGSHST